MNTTVCFIGCLIVFYLVTIEGKPKGDKVKIIVPHKISYIHHHHHHQIKGHHGKLKKAFYKTRLKPHHVYRNVDDDQEEDTDEGFDESDEDSDATKREIVYYAIPAAEFSKTGNDLSVKPVLLYRNDRPHRGKHPKRDKVSHAASTLRHQELPRPGRHLEDPWPPHKHLRPNFPNREKLYEYNLEI